MQIFRAFFLLFLISCTGAPSSIKLNEPASITQPNNSVPLVNNYGMYKTQSKKLLGHFKTNPNTFNERQLLKFINDSLMPCWYGTSWDFNGTSTQPQKGSIACGYFVTTVLQDIGLHLNRNKLAQCPSSILIERTCSNISRYSNKPLVHFINQIKAKGFGLYITGLDCHTGFIDNDSTEVYFIHSSYYTPKRVIKEKAIESAILKNSKIRMIGKINF